MTFIGIIQEKSELNIKKDTKRHIEMKPFNLTKPNRTIKPMDEVDGDRTPAPPQKPVKYVNISEKDEYL